MPMFFWKTTLHMTGSCKSKLVRAACVLQVRVDILALDKITS